MDRQDGGVRKTRREQVRPPQMVCVHTRLLISGGRESVSQPRPGLRGGSCVPGAVGTEGEPLPSGVDPVGCWKARQAGLSGGGVKGNTRLWVLAVAQTVRREHAFCFLTVQSETDSRPSFETPRDNETWHGRVLTYLSPLAVEFGCEAFGRRTRLPKRSDGTWCSGPAGFPLSAQPGGLMRC